MEWEAILQILLAVVVGGVIGAERQYRHGIGLRTLMLVCVGATLFTIYSDNFAFGEGDPRRIAAAVVTGVGFLGAGLIMRHQGQVMGLTTAASVWVVAALGMGIGMGLYVLVAVATVVVFAILWLVPRLDGIMNAPTIYKYEATIAMNSDKYKQITTLFQSYNLSIINRYAVKQNNQLICTWTTSGTRGDHEAIMQLLLFDNEVISFNVL